MNSNPSPLYNSLPLSIPRKSIRVLDFHDDVPGSLEDALRGHMRVVDLLDKPDFTALSYVWGAHHSPPHEICCDGFNVPITPNCRAALCALRQRFGPITIWVDSICINQQDDQEKASQISLMGNIYSLAATAYIWLGEETQGSEAAIDYLVSAGFQRHFISMADLNYLSQGSTWVYWRIAWSLLTRRYKELVAKWWNYGLWSAAATLLASVQGLPDKLIRYEGLEDFFSRDWSSRVWTLQEVILTKNPVIYCGQTVLYWRSIIYSVAYLEYVRQNYGVALPEANFNAWRNIVLLWLLMNSDSCHRDRRLDNSLLDEITLQRFMPEYWKFLEAITRRHRRLARIALCIQISFLFALLELRKILEMNTTIIGELSNIVIITSGITFIVIFVADPVFRWPVSLSNTPRHITDIPNAVINELCARKTTNPRDKFYGMYAIFSALNISVSSPQYSRTPEDVHRESFLVLLDWTKSLGLLLCSDGRRSDYESSWVPDWGHDLAQGWFDASYLLRKGPYDATPNSSSTWSLPNGKQLALRGVIVSSIVRKSEPFRVIDDDAIRLRYDQPQLFNALKALRDYCGSGNPILTRSKITLRNESNEWLLDYLDYPSLLYWIAILNRLAQNERLLFETLIPGQTTVGSCPAKVQLGDLIALASGVPLPLVLRPEESSYRFIGFAEVDGLMKGELWAKITEEDLVDIVLI